MAACGVPSTNAGPGAHSGRCTEILRFRDRGKWCVLRQLSPPASPTRLYCQSVLVRPSARGRTARLAWLSPPANGELDASASPTATTHLLRCGCTHDAVHADRALPPALPAPLSSTARVGSSATADCAAVRLLMISETWPERSNQAATKLQKSHMEKQAPGRHRAWERCTEAATVTAAATLRWRACLALMHATS